MGFRTRTAVALVTALAGLTMIVAPAGSATAADFEFVSTNQINQAADWPHVNEVSKGSGTVTLEFVNNTNSLAYFEYRIDGVVVVVNPVHGFLHDVQYPGVCVDGRTIKPVCSADPVEKTFTADEKVEVRFALGGENDWYFDWTPFAVGPVVGPADPMSKDDCKKGGWADFGFANQGQCIRFVNTGKDSR